MKKLIWIIALFAGVQVADAQQPQKLYLQLSPTPSYLANGGPGFIEIDANGIPFVGQAVPGSGTVTNAANLANNAVVVGDGGGAGVKTVGGSVGGAITTSGAFTTTGAASGSTLAFPTGGPFTFTYPGATSTLASLAGIETFTNKTYSGGVLGGTFSGAFTLSGVPSLTGLSAGAQVSCMGLNSSNQIVLLLSACGGGGSVSITSTTPNLVFTPSPLTGTGTLGSTMPGVDRSAANDAIVSGDATKLVKLGAHTYTIAQATGGLGAGWAACLVNTGTGDATITATTSVFAGAGGTTTLVLHKQASACLRSNGTDYETTVTNNLTAGSNVTLTYNNDGTISAAATGSAGAMALVSTISTPTTTGCGAVKCFAFTGLTPAANDVYNLQCHNIQVSVNASQWIGLQYGTGAGPTWEVDAAYVYNFMFTSGAAAPATSDSATANGISISFQPVSSAALGIGFNGMIYDLANATKKLMLYAASSTAAGPVRQSFNGQGYYSTNNTAVTALRVIDINGSPADISSGTCSVFKITG